MRFFKSAGVLGAIAVVTYLLVGWAVAKILHLSDLYEVEPWLARCVVLTWAWACVTGAVLLGAATLSDTRARRNFGLQRAQRSLSDVSEGVNQ